LWQTAEYRFMVSTHMKKIKLREVLLLIVPIMVLTPLFWRWEIGTWLPVWRTAPVQNGYEVEIKSVKTQAPTPREVYEGFDTRVVVEFNNPQFSHKTGWKYYGTGVSYLTNERLIEKNQSGWKKLYTKPPFKRGVKRSQPERIVYVESFKSEKVIYKLRLHDFPTTQGELFLRGELESSVWFEMPLGQKRLISNLQPVSVKVRDANQKVQLKPTTMWRPFRFYKGEVKRVSHQEAVGGEDTLIDVFIEQTVDKNEASYGDFWAKCKWVDPHLENEKRQRLSMRPGPGGVFRLNPTKVSGPKNIYKFPMCVTLWRVLPKTGKVIFKGALSYNDGWPLPVEIVVREK
jgi:hypothetical protein